ncbi:MAG: hypothetical protein QJR02_07125 [Sinobacteraceae bacterium]|nr:hypothetical protein [Nevskiaceae bacterium]
MNYVYSLVAALCAVGAEAWMRSHHGPHWWSPIFAPAWVLALGVNWGVWNILRTETLIGFTIIFSCCTALLRIVWTLWRGEAIPPVHWVAFGMVLCASILKGVYGR